MDSGRLPEAHTPVSELRWFRSAAYPTSLNSLSRNLGLFVILPGFSTPKRIRVSSGISHMRLHALMALLSVQFARNGLNADGVQPELLGGFGQTARDVPKAGEYQPLGSRLLPMQ